MTPRFEHQSVQSFPVFRTLHEPRKNWLEKLLSLFADVRAGEGRVVVVLTVNLALLLASYYLLKTVREALILTEGGAEVKSYSAAAQAFSPTQYSGSSGYAYALDPVPRDCGAHSRSEAELENVS